MQSNIARVLSAVLPITILGLATVVACGSTSTTQDLADAGGGSETDAGNELVGVGASCATGCIGSKICANESDSCETGYCLFDGREDSFESYCTADCSAQSCPAGYSCTDIPFSLERACVADPSVCGNSILERGETCDDGNTQSDDGCRGDCQQIDTPLADQWRIATTATASGTYIPAGSSAPEQFSIQIEIDDMIPRFGHGCEVAIRTIPNGRQLPRYLVGSCGAGGYLTVATDIPKETTNGTTPPRPCISLRLPHPNGIELQPGGALLGTRVRYCSGIDGVQTIRTTVSPAPAETLDISGNLSGTLMLVPNQLIGGCERSPAPAACPEIIGDIQLAMTFEITNAP